MKTGLILVTACYIVSIIVMLISITKLSKTRELRLKHLEKRLEIQPFIDFRVLKNKTGKYYINTLINTKYFGTNPKRFDDEDSAMLYLEKILKSKKLMDMTADLLNTQGGDNNETI